MKKITIFLAIFFGFSAAVYGYYFLSKTPESAFLPPIPQKEEESALDRDTLRETIPASPSDYFPVTKGLYWSYTGEGNEYASFIRQVLFTEGNRAQIEEDNGGAISVSVFEVTPEALTRIHFIGEAYDIPNLLNRAPSEHRIILQEPLEVGTKWINPGESREIISLGETVVTPAGTFEDALVIKSTYEHSEIYEYFVVDIGMVKREFFSGDYRVLSILEDYGLQEELK
ncbi:hypothetical protein [Heliorestis convoluta]|uniref:Uncharacterized protein n=1 Tax=Heliorestis convoluta TaxID=356322 RepID=A0A5Q2N2E1_9FIRM|nr:hypothetical protein [Heliorestis convoluta]QGG46735.1 hypothetical protein FTV88_0556 [Heliorestis convoluta]